MKAAVLEELKTIVVKDVPDPICEDGDVIVKVHACAICGTDLRTFNFGHRNIVLPHILGHEISGEIVEVGKNVNNFKVGDTVSVYPAIACNECDWCRRGYQVRCENTLQIGDELPGGFAQYVRIPEKGVKNGSLIAIPKNMDHKQAALAEPLGCVLNGQELSDIGLGDTVVIIGAGPIGCMHAMLAKAQGANKVIMADIKDERLELAKRVNADYYVNSSKENLLEKILEFNDGRKADVVIVACNVTKVVEDSLELLDWEGRLSIFAGMPKDNSMVTVDANIVHYKDIKLVGSYGSTYWQHVTALNLIKDGVLDIKNIITHELPLEDIDKGLELVRKGESLKVVVIPW
ncbi:zinc-dependent dehydrogenase [Tepidimicrobium xylanilyticum]|uniref:L-iditol 2-dehydrogenase n=1 Tax=Tepidimicrobium xylanilyticum TaxID=1123352 RepID=A0A1H2W5V8_9FIRM|nr:zinc-dependent dehydrogenase [Tepidimicrobium xylanilyticum]SDW75654.1 L-iditol 2-dehydrogenase [Tepidimicrobium xylanilyticum]